ncbi:MULTISPECIES: hypothetical protein [Paenibacillus]|uniref:hypothetical protein n=1 Tax=Paenibacillus TaxID=44249 RepID=UPI0008CC26E9|nr:MULTISPECIES: hypothetical protein [Paenibacillus]KAF6585178.1 hypothetical protein G9G57_07520 [Paenibacillus sp. EKM211P]SEI75336.1 hypothetical protein SAMN04488600_101585 [Paenibacillus polymyxa]
MTISKREANRRANERWSQWRLLLSDMGVTYSDLFLMDDDDLAEANAALDIHIKQQERAANKPK